MLYDQNLVFLTYAMRATWSTQPITLDLITLQLFGDT
jgi:hypothetical protein